MPNICWTDQYLITRFQYQPEHYYWYIYNGDVIPMDCDSSWARCNASSHMSEQFGYRGAFEQIEAGISGNRLDTEIDALCSFTRDDRFSGVLIHVL